MKSWIGSGAIPLMRSLCRDKLFPTEGLIHLARAMLTGFPTKRGTGIAIYGDHADLRSLYTTVHKFSEKQGQAPTSSQATILMNFAYEVRKAYEDQRLNDSLTVFGAEVRYPGFNFLWTDVLVLSNVAHRRASQTNTGELDYVNLVMLDRIIREAMEAYDPVGAGQLRNFIGQRIDVSSSMLVQISEYVTAEYLSQRPSKKRFRSIVEMFIKFFSTHTKDHQELMATFAVRALELNCEPQELLVEHAEDRIVW